MTTEVSVCQRYANAAQRAEAALCCPVDYDPRHLKIIPAEVIERDAAPWRTVNGIEFRSITVRAFKGLPGSCLERNQAVIYQRPFKEVLDDDGHRLTRGVRHAVCDKTFQLYRKDPYRVHFDFVEPQTPVPLDQAQPFDCRRLAPRHPRETKGVNHQATTDASVCRDGGNGACC